MSFGAGEKGTFKPIDDAQSQKLPGTEAAMNPTSEATKLEGATRFHEYTGVGKLRNKKVLITGGEHAHHLLELHFLDPIKTALSTSLKAPSDIGRSVAILMAREGADITIVYLPEEQEDAESTKKSVEGEKRSCLLVPGNLMDNQTCKKAVDEHVKKYERIDVLVNNASKQAMCAKFEEIDLEMTESIFRSNVLQMFAITKYALPHMRKGGSIINTTSVVAFRGTVSMVDYAASKAAIVGFTRALAKNLVSKSIRVNGVAPGPVHTPLQPASRPAEQMEGFGSKSQLGRPGQPSEIAPTYLFLASGEAELYYGQIMHPYPLGD